MNNVREYMIVADNPFVKSVWPSDREWEESLVAFFAVQARCPDERQWLSFADDPTARSAAGFSAWFLANWAETISAHYSQSEALYAISRSLLGADVGPMEYGDWFRTGWLSVARVARMLNARCVSAWVNREAL